MSRAQARIRAAKRNQFQQRQQVNRLFAERRSQGMTAAQAATTPYVVKDTDTLGGIASANGVDVTNLLDANPELKNLQTGMVINTPQPRIPPGTEAWRARGFSDVSGGIGLPSNAALGGTTTNPSGFSPYRQDQQYRAPLNTTTPAYTAYGTITSNQPELYAPYANGPGTQRNSQRNTPYPLYAGSVQAAQQQTGQKLGPVPYAGSIAATAQNIIGNNGVAQPLSPAAPASPLRPAQQPRNYSQSALAGLQAYRITELYNNVNAGSTPTDAQMQYLIQRGLIAPSPQGSGGGGYYRRRRGGGGGGRGRKKPGVAAPQPQLPAFSSGSSSFSLVNWRI